MLKTFWLSEALLGLVAPVPGAGRKQLLGLHQLCWKTSYTLPAGDWGQEARRLFIPQREIESSLYSEQLLRLPRVHKPVSWCQQWADHPRSPLQTCPAEHSWLKFHTHPEVVPKTWDWFFLMILFFDQRDSVKWNLLHNLF